MENVSGIHPTNDLVLVQPLETETRSPGGIVLPSTTQEREEMANIHGLLVEVTEIAQKHPALKGIELGDMIIHAKFAGVRHKGHDGVWYRLMRVEDVIGRLDQMPDKSLKGRETLGEVLDRFDNELSAA